MMYAKPSSLQEHRLKQFARVGWVPMQRMSSVRSFRPNKQRQDLCPTRNVLMTHPLTGVMSLSKCFESDILSRHVL